jgi:hypothetical protein
MRYLKAETCFCFEPLRDVQQRNQEAVDGNTSLTSWTEWRPLDFASIMNHRGHMSQWVEDYPRRRDTPGELEAYPQVRVIGPTYFTTTQPDVSEADLSEILETGRDFARAYAAAMSEESGAWQHNQTRLPEKLMRIMRQPEWGRRF